MPTGAFTGEPCGDGIGVAWPAGVGEAAWTGVGDAAGFGGSVFVGSQATAEMAIAIAKIDVDINDLPIVILLNYVNTRT